MSNSDLFGLATRFPPSIPIEDQQLVMAMLSLIRSRRIETIDDLANAIAADEANLPKNVLPHPSSVEAGRQITLILEERPAPRRQG